MADSDPNPTVTAKASRRGFLSGAVGIAAATIGVPVRPRRSRPLGNSWIPSEAFLADLPGIMSVASLPGLAIAVVENGEVAWTRFVGIANAETKTPIREDTIFQAASMSKPVFAYVVLRLADERLLDLDRPLVEYRRPEYLARDPNVDLITARDVLRHTTGLSNWRIRPEEILTPAFKPGTRYRYSGEGYFWLQLVVEQLTGRGIDTVMRSRLFEPGGMSASTYAWDAERSRRDVYGHTGPGEGEGQLGFQQTRELGDRLLQVAAKWNRPMTTWTFEDAKRAIEEARDLSGPHPLPNDMAKAPIDYFKLPVNLSPNVAGSLGTTVTDYARFMILMLERRRRASWEISDAARTAMLAPAIEVKPNAISWGLGWGLERPASGPLFLHGGNNSSLFKTFGLGDPAGRRAIVVLTNGGGGYAVYQRIIRAATGHDLFEFLLGG